MDAEDRAKRFRAARGKKTPNEVYKETGIMTSMISDLENDMKDRGVKYQDIAKLAKCYGVSAGYLIGTEDDATTDTNIRAICEYTGLSSKAVERLHDWNTNQGFWKQSKEWINTLSEMIENDYQNSPDGISSSEKQRTAIISSLFDIVHYNSSCLQLYRHIITEGGNHDLESIGSFSEGELFIGDNIGLKAIGSSIMIEALWHDFRERVQAFSTEQKEVSNGKY